MNLRVRWSIGVALLLFVCAAIWKTRVEVQRRWRGQDSTAWVEVAAEKNPSIWWPNPTDVSEGRDPVRPIREPAAVPVRADVTLRWASVPFTCEMKNERAPSEDGERFAERAGSDAAAMLRAFPAR